MEIGSGRTSKLRLAYPKYNVKATNKERKSFNGPDDEVRLCTFGQSSQQVIRSRHFIVQYIHGRVPYSATAVPRNGSSKRCTKVRGCFAIQNRPKVIALGNSRNKALIRLETRKTTWKGWWFACGVSQSDARVHRSRSHGASDPLCRRGYFPYNPVLKMTLQQKHRWYQLKGPATQ